MENYVKKWITCGKEGRNKIHMWKKLKIKFYRQEFMERTENFPLAK